METRECHASCVWCTTCVRLLVCKVWDLLTDMESTPAYLAYYAWWLWAFHILSDLPVTEKLQSDGWCEMGVSPGFYFFSAEEAWFSAHLSIPPISSLEWEVCGLAAFLKQPSFLLKLPLHQTCWLCYNRTCAFGIYPEYLWGLYEISQSYKAWISKLCSLLSKHKRVGTSHHGNEQFFECQIPVKRYHGNINYWA